MYCNNAAFQIVHNFNYAHNKKLTFFAGNFFFFECCIYPWYVLWRVLRSATFVYERNCTLYLLIHGDRSLVLAFEDLISKLRDRQAKLHSHLVGPDPAVLNNNSSIDLSGEWFSPPSTKSSFGSSWASVVKSGEKNSHSLFLDPLRLTLSHHQTSLHSVNFQPAAPPWRKPAQWVTHCPVCLWPNGQGCPKAFPPQLNGVDSIYDTLPIYLPK